MFNVYIFHTVAFVRSCFHNYVPSNPNFPFTFMLVCFLCDFVRTTASFISQYIISETLFESSMYTDFCNLTIWLDCQRVYDIMFLAQDSRVIHLMLTASKHVSRYMYQRCLIMILFCFWLTVIKFYICLGQVFGVEDSLVYITLLKLCEQSNVKVNYLIFKWLAAACCRELK